VNSLPASLHLVSVPAESHSPNAGPSFENAVFDPTYYGLTALIIVVALAAAVFALKSRIDLRDQVDRGQASGTGSASLGFAIVFVAATAFLALLRSGLIGGFLYQQAQFSVVYVGTAMMLYGVDRTVIPMADTGLRSLRANRATMSRAALWTTFGVSVFIACGYLFSPSTYSVTVSGATRHVAQQAVFWLPPFIASATGAVGVLLFSLRHKDATIRRHAMWFGSFFGLQLLGMLRESTLIPSAGDPLADLLVAFIPFTAGGFCLLASALTLRPSGPGHPKEIAPL